MAGRRLQERGRSTGVAVDPAGLAPAPAGGKTGAMPAAAPTRSAGFETELDLPDEAATAALAVRLGPVVGAGDTLLLGGPIGAGKTAFARRMIQALQSAAGAPVEEVPSPTFTLVQTYSAGPLEIWHADLYRLSGPAEVAELGLDEAFGTALCLVEWPDRLGRFAPPQALTLDFAPSARPEARRLRLSGPAAWATRLAPALAGAAG